MVTHFDELKRVQAVEMKPMLVAPIPSAPASAAAGASGGAGGSMTALRAHSVLMPQFDSTSEKDRQLLVNTLIHTADLSGQGMWSDLRAWCVDGLAYSCMFVMCVL
jgi:hypothetical protein